MLKRYLLFAQLVLLPITQLHAQFTAGGEGFYIQPGTEVYVDGLVLEPENNVGLTYQTLNISTIPVPGNVTGINRVYRFTTPFNFTGKAGFFYNQSELNGNIESSLELIYGDGTHYYPTVGSTVDENANFISNRLVNVSLGAVTAGKEVTLPVALSQFYLSRKENLTVLHWQTTQEKDSHYYEVLHSLNGKKWEVLGRVEAAGQSSGVATYSFTDAAMRRGMQYYRLRMVDLDGSSTLSPVQSIQLGGELLISAYPNPVTDRLVIDAGEAISHLGVTDLTGRRLQVLDNPDGEVDLRQYPSGMYLLTVETVSGHREVLKVLKK